MAQKVEKIITRIPDGWKYFSKLPDFSIDENFRLALSKDPSVEWMEEYNLLKDAIKELNPDQPPYVYIYMLIELQKRPDIIARHPISSSGGRRKSKRTSRKKRSASKRRTSKRRTSRK